MIETNAFSTFIFLNSLITVIITQLDKVLLANNVSKQDFSYFIISNNLAYYILIAVTPITVTLFPKFSQLFQEKKFSELKKNFYKFIRGCRSLYNTWKYNIISII